MLRQQSMHNSNELDEITNAQIGFHANKYKKLVQIRRLIVKHAVQTVLNSSSNVIGSLSIKNAIAQHAYIQTC